MADHYGWLIALVSAITGLSVTELAHVAAHHKEQLAALAVAVAAWAYRWRRLFVSTGTRAAPRTPKTKEAPC